MSRGGVGGGQEDVATIILAIIKCEQDQDFWQQLNYTFGKARGRSSTLVQVEGLHDSVEEQVTKASVEDVSGQTYTARGSI